MSLDTEQCSVGTNNKKSHLTKDERSPKLYRDVARVLKDVKSMKANLKTALYSANIRRFVFDKVYALTCSVLKHLKVIDRVLEDVKLMVKEPRLNLELAEILIHEICVAQKPFKGNSKPVVIVQQYQEDIEKSFAKHFSAFSPYLSSKEEENYVPRYARVNTLITDVPQVISALRKKHFYEVVYDDNITLDQYHEKVKQLQPYEFLIDFHFKDLLVFQRNQNLCQLQLYQNGHIFLQDKSSYIPVHILSPPPGSVAFDACAAPGMKTVHIAACMENLGKIFATDYDEKRFTILKETLNRGHVEICKSCCCNFTDVDPHDEQFSSVEYVLVDPSCSGSGMVNRMDHVTDDEQSKSEDRFRKLAGFQIVLLKRALSFPSVKRVVYSTCSVSEIENEFVVHEALSHYQHLFQLVPALPGWPTRGQGKYEFSHLCLRSFPNSNLTNGFFVAVFERLPDIPINPKKSKCESEKISSEVLGCQKNDERMPSDSQLLLENKDSQRRCKIEGSENQVSSENFSEKLKKHYRGTAICTESGSLCGTDQNVLEYSSNKPNESLTESVIVKKHKKRKRKTYEQSDANDDFQDTVHRSHEELPDVQNNMDESVTVKKHKRKKLGDLDNCDVTQTVDTISDEFMGGCGESTVIKRHKKKKHRDTEPNSSKLQLEHCDAKESVEGCGETSAVKKHKKKKCKDTKHESSDGNLQLKHYNVEENMEGCCETSVVKRHKKKKHRDSECNSSNDNLQSEHGDVKENVGGCGETSVVKRHKRMQHRDSEHNSSRKNSQLKLCDVDVQSHAESEIVKKHKKKKDRSEGREG